MDRHRPRGRRFAESYDRYDAELSGFLHAKFNQVVAEAEPELLAKETRQMSAAAAAGSSLRRFPRRPGDDAVVDALLLDRVSCVMSLICNLTMFLRSPVAADWR
jgi:hypothetical protein